MSLMNQLVEEEEKLKGVELAGLTSRVDKLGSEQIRSIDGPKYYIDFDHHTYHTTIILYKYLYLTKKFSLLVMEIFIGDNIACTRWR